MTGTSPRAAAPLGPAPSSVLAWFRSGGRPLVALSGGVDSAVVALLAKTALPGVARAATLVGPAVSPREVERARAVAGTIGIEHDLVPVDPLAVEGYRRNPANRCYFCRGTEARALRSFGASLGVARYVDGVHADDLSDDRPGLRALDESGFEHPLLLAGWGKRQVREFARSAGLPNWDEPSDSCLASRVPHGTPISADVLDRVARAEERLRQRGYRRVRVRVAGDGARVEFDPADLPRLSKGPERSAAIAAVTSEGFASAEIDPRGYRLRANA